MDKICEFLKSYYSDNGITEKKSMLCFKSQSENSMTDEKAVDYIQKKLHSYFKSCLADIKIKKLSDLTIVEFLYKENLCEIYLLKTTKKVNHWVLVYY